MKYILMKRNALDIYKFFLLLRANEHDQYSLHKHEVALQ